jgi:hypothetical protein
MKSLFGFAIAVFAAQPAIAQSAGDDPSFSITTGVDYTTGAYGATEDTDILVVPVSARFKTGDWRFTATLPYLRIDGAGSIVGGGEGGPIIIDPNAPRSSRDGFGDVSLGATYSALKESSAGLNVDLAVGVKLPTASEDDGLGTGKADYTVSADFSKTFGSISPFVTVGYRVPGDPDGINLDNAFSVSVGTTIELGSSVAILSYDYRQSTSDLADDGQEIFGAFSGPLGKRTNWTLYGSAGLSDGSPDVGAGLMLTFNLF